MKKVYTLTVIILILIIVIIFEVRRISRLESIITTTQNDILNHYTSDGIEQQFTIALQEPNQLNLKALYFQLLKQEGLSRALLTLNAEQIKGNLGDNFFYSDKGEALSGAAPVFLLNILMDDELQPIEKEALERLETEWIKYHEETKTILVDRSVTEPVSLAASYIDLVENVKEITQSLR